jgi:hypothetical protein
VLNACNSAERAWCGDDDEREREREGAWNVRIGGGGKKIRGSAEWILGFWLIALFVCAVFCAIVFVLLGPKKNTAKKSCAKIVWKATDRIPQRGDADASSHALFEESLTISTIRKYVIVLIRTQRSYLIS